MSSSYSTSGTSTVSCVRPKKEPEVTVDDVAVVVAGLNNKVLQLRREILALRASPISERATQRVGYQSPEDGQSKIAARELFPKKEEYYSPRRRKNNSQSIRKNSRLMYAERFRSADKRRLSNQDKTPKVLYEPKKGREKSMKSFVNNGYNDEKTNVKEYSSDRIHSDESKHEISRRISTERRKNSGQVLTEKSKLGYTKRKENYVGSSRNRNISKVNKKIVKNDDEEMKRSENYERDRIVLPSRVSLKCQGIRHAFGLSNAYCNCGSGARVRKKRISRGVQCDSSDINKDKIPSSLGGCFAFKCCIGKSKKSQEKKSNNSAQRTESVVSSGIYRRNKNEYKKETKETEEAIRKKMLLRKVTRNQRMVGGGDEMICQRLKIGETLAPKRNDKTDGLQHHQRVIRRKIQAIEDRSINKNDIIDIKRRLNECLIELNGIIGDVGFIFDENN